MRYRLHGPSLERGWSQTTDHVPGFPSGNWDYAGTKASAVRALTVIETHAAGVARALEDGMGEKEAVSALAGLRREVMEFESHLAKARLEHLRVNGDPTQRSRAAELLHLLNGRELAGQGPCESPAARGPGVGN